MSNKFLDGIKLGLGFIFVIGIIFGLAWAVGFHNANEILSGTFVGDFIFQDDVVVKGDFKLNNSVSSCNSSNEGSLKYDSGKVNFCDGSDWTELSGISPVLGNDIYTRLLLHCDDAALSDSSLSAQTITKNGNVARSSTQSRFGGYSCYFDGTGDYLTTSDTGDWDFGTGDWTLDAWIYSTGDGYDNVLYTGGENSVNGIFFGLSNGNYYFQSHSDHIFTYSQDLRNDWHHIAAVRSGDVTYHFIDGSLVGTMNVAGINMDNSYVPSIGSAASNYYIGYIDEFRVSKGIGRWTNSFTPPTGPYS